MVFIELNPINGPRMKSLIIWKERPPADGCRRSATCLQGLKQVACGNVVSMCGLSWGQGEIQSIQSKRKTSNANGQTNLGHKHKAPDHNHEATQPMVDLPHTS